MTRLGHSFGVVGALLAILAVLAFSGGNESQAAHSTIAQAKVSMDCLNNPDSGTCK